MKHSILDLEERIKRLTEQLSREVKFIQLLERAHLKRFNEVEILIQAVKTTKENGEEFIDLDSYKVKKMDIIPIISDGKGNITTLTTWKRDK